MFTYSTTNKRYHTFSYFASQAYGGKTVRVPLDAGFSCPNRALGGCIFCAGGASGAVAADSIEAQYAAGIERVRAKWRAERFIPYLQANTNTFAPADVLRDLYQRCARLPGAVALAIATRADCLPDDVIDLLAETTKLLPVTVELGMQTMHDATLTRIHRGYDHASFLAGYARLDRLRAAGLPIRIGLHILNGLPGESTDDMRTTAREAARLAPDFVKLHTLCVLRDTPLAAMYECGDYTPLTRDEALFIVCDQLAVLPPECVIERIMADAPREALLAPIWTRDKRAFENALDMRMAAMGLEQGMYYTAQPTDTDINSRCFYL